MSLQHCDVSLELLSAQTLAPGPLLDADWKCRKCGDIASNHKSQPGKTQFFLLILFSITSALKLFLYVSSHISIALDNLKSHYISHLISPSRLLLSVK
jgi:hypothetical protein